MCELKDPIFISVTLMFPFRPLSHVGKISKLSGHYKCESYNYCTARMGKVHLGSQSPNISFPLSAHTIPSPRGESGRAAFELCSCWVSLSIRTHISGPESYLGTGPNTPPSSVATKSPYYEPSNLGPATIGIWHQIFISPLDTISVTSDRHGSPISPVHLSCSCQPTTQCRLRNDKKQTDQVWAKKQRYLLYLEKRGEC